MNSLTIILISIVALSAGYLFYGRWLAKRWGIDEKAKRRPSNMKTAKILSVIEIHRILPSVFIDCRGRTGHGTDSGIRIRMGAGIALADHRRPVFRRRTGLWRFIRIREK